MIGKLIGRIGQALYIPAPRWLSEYAKRDLDREIAAHEAELAQERRRAEPRDDRVEEIERGLREVTRLRERFP